MLLTSSQVSVAVSSGIVILCTAALFLSGYVLQQRTLRDLREAIKPRPSPKMFLPDRFKQSTTELADGSIVILDDGSGEPGQKQETVIEVKPSTPDDAWGDQQPKSDDSTDYDEKEKSVVTVKAKGKNGKGKSSAEVDSEKLQKPMSRAERRRRIKEEIMRSSQSQERGGYYQRRMW